MITVVVLDASPKPDRYTFMAMERIAKHGYKAVPVNPGVREILGESGQRPGEPSPPPPQAMENAGWCE